MPHTRNMQRGPFLTDAISMGRVLGGFRRATVRCCIEDATPAMPAAAPMPPAVDIRSKEATAGPMVLLRKATPADWKAAAASLLPRVLRPALALIAFKSIPIPSRASSTL